MKLVIMRIVMTMILNHFPLKIIQMLNFHDSDYNLSDDDNLFEANIDKNAEFIELSNKPEIGKSYKETVDKLANINGDSDSGSTELSSGCTSSDEEGGSSKKEKMKYKVFNEKTDIDNPQFLVGMEFKTHALFRDAVKKHGIKCGKVIKFLKSDKSKVRVVCRGGKRNVCSWLIYVAYVPADKVFRVKTYVGTRTCTGSYHVPCVSTKWICKKYTGRIRSNPTWPVKSLIETIEQEWTCKVSLPVVFRAKKKALDLIDGTANEQFGLSYAYAEEVMSGNLGTRVIIKTKPVVGATNQDILWKVARATSVPAFRNAMDEMNKADPNAYKWLYERPPINWFRSHFITFPKCDILLNNLCESFNSSILIARDQSIITMLERIRHILTDMVVKRREATEQCKGEICPKIYKLVEKLKDHVGEWVTTYTCNNKFEVCGPTRQYKVDLAHKICGCRRWDLNGIPCVNTVAAYNLFDQDPLNHVHQCYNKETYLKTYTNMRAGRPKKARRREPKEQATENPDPTRLGRKGTKMTCSKCGVQGHNKRSCKKEPIVEQSTEEATHVVEQSAHGTSGLVRRNMKKAKQRMVEEGPT
ncbi:hypothetical protein Vadar_007510 [Vaccinium darrowii]|uniref:Uncharacterized protein n=1 Tax=Vaccinium darrowii TaxID=229202 RepID=A0ACB7WYP9_9ERIC|nr:hypothetical protein Vadar_007510 [Vaccinium darrowii]